jgi:hypothetical protein
MTERFEATGKKWIDEALAPLKEAARSAEPAQHFPDASSPVAVMTRPQTAEETRAMVAAAGVHPRLQKAEERAKSAIALAHRGPLKEAIQSEVDRLQAALDSAGFALMHVQQRGDAEAVAKAYGIGAMIGDAATQFVTFVRVTEQPVPLTSLGNVERLDSLEFGLIAMSGDGNKAYTHEHFGGVLPKRCQPQHAEFWGKKDQGGRPLEIGAAIGLMNSDELRERLKARGILAWHSRVSRFIRIVDTNWLHSDHALVDWVAGEGAGGWSCRCCGMFELNGDELVQVARRRLIPTKAPQFTQDRIHEQCYPHWSEMVGKVAGLSGQSIAVMPRTE